MGLRSLEFEGGIALDGESPRFDPQRGGKKNLRALDHGSNQPTATNYSIIRGEGKAQGVQGPPDKSLA